MGRSSDSDASLETLERDSPLSDLDQAPIQLGRIRIRANRLEPCDYIEILLGLFPSSRGRRSTTWGGLTRLTRQGRCGSTAALAWSARRVR
jgi:hypothetical protein